MFLFHELASLGNYHLAAWLGSLPKTRIPLRAATSFITINSCVQFCTQFALFLLGWAKLGKVGQSWAKLGKVGQSWAKLGMPKNARLFSRLFHN